ncbi:MAG: DUF4332 domain-containing protein [Halioglobus sp.]
MNLETEIADIEGVGQRYAPLLRSVGVDTVVALAATNGTTLRKRLAQCNANEGLVEVLPSESIVVRWVARAKVKGLALSLGKDDE